ncbi:VPS35 endosomal protein-sorting factor-like [Tribolium castaneum]|uniref:VPS35 endosomal protein-sorting factor-like n=1 Tax=Tribolium castaneum TaxID=7070 RepID=UPI00046C386B|nr:PREDICTED: UPF0505 protein C16orf62 homolog [Tribolium castaneum]|eukprot:XP_008195313.1 PREDICTED: UPF0505 protein C16orf62 homolog [Tribolium castaneum]
MSSNYNIEWKTCTDEHFSAKTKGLSGVKTTDHPLKTAIVTERVPRRILGSQPSTGRTTPVSTPSVILEPLSMALEGVDPLTAFAIEEMDPLTKLAAQESRDKVDSSQDKKLSDYKCEVDAWAMKKASILSKYTTSEKISIVTSFLSDGDKVVVKAQSTAVDKMQHRLEQLDYIEEGSQTRLDLSQTEYVNRIEQLNRELVSAWNSEQRVKALKIAIQCAKLLSDTSVLTFYPSKFVLITDILDVFGQLVYNRLSTKTDSHKLGSKTKLPEDFTPEMVSDSAKETCLNWFYKIASIRELVPRLYVEMALMKSYYFLSLSECQEALRRLTHMINGIGNPLVAVYARCYLCRVGCSLSNRIKNKEYLLQNFHRFLQNYQHLFSRSVKGELAQQKVSQSVYMSLFTPALDYMLQTVACDNSDALLNELLERCKVHGNSSLILNTVMSAFKPHLISARTLQFLEMIEHCLDQGIPLHSLLRTLGLCVSVAPPPLEHRRQILSTAWKHITGLKQVEEYIACAEPWVLYVVKYFSHRELNTILGDIIDHIAPDRSYEQYYNQLKNVVENIVLNIQDFEALLVMDNFLPLIDLFQQESIRVEVCKKVLSGSNSNLIFVNDAVVVNALMFLCTVLHDSVNALTPEDEYRQIGDILCHVIKTIDYGRDFEQQLTFYVEARASFSNIDIVFVQLVQCVNALSVKTRQIVKGLHTRKTGDFVRACAAYCFITVPSIKSAKHRLRLYLLSGQVALFNHCLGQADACFKAALTTISEIQNDKTQFPESELIPYVKQFLSILLVVPDNPDCSVLNLTRALLNVLQGYSWESNISLISIYLSVIDMLSVMAQEWYPYHIDKVESNDSLYGSDKKFIAEINKICSVVTNELMSKLQSLGPCTKQSTFAIELFVKLAVRNDLTNQMLVLALNLWNLAKRDNTLDTKYLIRTKNYVKKRTFACNNTLLQELVNKME